MRIPAWLHQYWMMTLWPALSKRELSPARVTEILTQTLQDWQQQSSELTKRPLSNGSIGRYATETRNWLRELPSLELCPAGCRKFSPAEMAMIVEGFTPPEAFWSALIEQSREALERRPQLLLPDPWAIVTQLGEMLRHPDWAPLAVGLGGDIGRRVGEVFTGELEPCSAYSVKFRGRLKRPEDDRGWIEIPTLNKADIVLDGWKRLREHPDILAMELPLLELGKPKVLQAVNQRLSPYIRKAANHYFQDLIPRGLDEDGQERDLYTHLFRSVYRTIAIWLYCPIHTDPDRFSAQILGHTYYQSLATKREQLNFATEHHYHRYAISDGKGNIDGRRGLRLGEPEVQVVEAFAKDYAMQLEVQSEKASRGAKTRKRTATSVEPRTTKTGYSSLKPKVETRQWFNQVAEENKLLWKQTNETLLLLLRTYEEHKQCASDGTAAFNPEHLLPQQLGVSEDLEGRIVQAMQALDQPSFLEFLLHALDREANVQIGLQKSRIQRETVDLSLALLETFQGSKRPEAALERARRAVATVIDYNRRCNDPNSFWFINGKLIRDLTRGNPDYIRPVLDVNAEFIKTHHAHFGITVDHNTTPAHKAKPIAEDPALAIPNNPADLKSLSDLKTPTLEDVAASKKKAEASKKKTEEPSASPVVSAPATSEGTPLPAEVQPAQSK